MRRKIRFPHHICVRKDVDDQSDVIVGTPENPTMLDANDGDTVAIYVLQEVTIYRTNAALTGRSRPKGAR